jgi:RNA polymerase sigma-70 factor (ECF subfamily)
MSTGMDGEETNDGRGERNNEALFVEHYAFMFAAARKVLRNRNKADAEDVIQSLYFKLAEAELPPDIWEDPKGYLYRAVVNACHDWRRSGKSRKEKQGVEELEIEEPRSGVVHENASNEVEHLLGSLDESVAEVVMLHAESGHSDAEIAAMIGGSRSKVSMILSRAREKLRKMRHVGAGPPKKGFAADMPEPEE